MAPKCFISLASIENVVLLRCHLDGAALHFHSKTIRRVQKLAAREALWRRLFAHVLGNVDMLVLGSVQGRRLFAHVLGNIDMLVLGSVRGRRVFAHVY